MDEMKEKVKLLGIESAVFFLGQKEDANKYYNTFDLFLFPSLYEGLGMVVVEAQYNGLPCVVSTEVPEIAKITDRIKQLLLEISLNEWTTEIKHFINTPQGRNDCVVTNDNYDITKEAVKLEEKYIEFLQSVRLSNE